MKLRPDTVVASPFMGNFFCVIPETDLAFIVISKNSCTFLKKVAIYNATGKWIATADEAHRIIGYNDSSGFLIPVTGIGDYEKKNGPLTKFAVWRDPVERFVSTYKYFCMEMEYRTYFHYLNLLNDNSFERFLDFAVFELQKKDPVFQDEHIRRQVDYYPSCEIDYIVPMNRLNTFLEENGVSLVAERSNRTDTTYKIEQDHYQQKIRTLYEQDFLIRTNY